MKKGVVQFIPLIAVALVMSLGSIGVMGTVRSRAIDQSQVLANSTGDKGQGQEKSDNSNKQSFSTNKQSFSTNKSQGNSNFQSSVDKESNSGKNLEKTENEGKSREKTSIGGSKKESEFDIEIESEDEDDEATKEASPSVTPGRKIRTNFPITVNPITNEKIVTTPGGTKVIILPEVAIQNMIKAGFPVVLPPELSPTPSSSPEATLSATPEGTPSATPEATESAVVDESGILLTEQNGELVYEIPAVKDERFLGLVGVKIKVKGIVSAEDGEIIKIQKSIFDNILDLLSI